MTTLKPECLHAGSLSCTIHRAKIAPLFLSYQRQKHSSQEGRIMKLTVAHILML